MATNKMRIDIYTHGDITEAPSGNVATSSQEMRGMSTSGSTRAGTTGTGAVDYKPLKTFVSSQTLTVFIDNTKELITSNVGLVTGKQELQQRVDLALSTFQKATNMAGNIGAGATITQALGWGKLTGGILGAVLSVFQFGLNTYFAQQNLNLQASIENKQIQQTASRMGASYNRSRSGQ